MIWNVERASAIAISIRMPFGSSLAVAERFKPSRKETTQHCFHCAFSWFDKVRHGVSRFFETIFNKFVL